MKLNTLSKLFILGQILDFITTYIGVKIGLNDLNIFVNLGWGYTIIMKIISIILIVYVLQMVERFHAKLFYLIPIVSLLIPIWNTYAILISL